MKKILFSIESLIGGGAEKLLVLLCQTLQEKGVKAELFTFSHNNGDYAVPKGIARHNLPFADIGYEEKAKIVSEWLINQERKQGAYDLIVSNLRSSDEIWSRVNHDSIYFCIHNHTSTRDVMDKKWWQKKKILAEIRTLYTDKNLIAVSQGVADDLIDNLNIRPKSICVIPNGFDFEEIRKLSLEPLNAPCEQYILHVGSFKAQKRHDRLLEAYAKSDIAYPLVLLGKGSASRTKKIKRWIKKYSLEGRVYMPGFSDNPYTWIARAQMLVLSSDCEGFGRVLVEALALGVPVVSTNCPSGPSDILNGELIKGLSALNVSDLSKK